MRRSHRTLSPSHKHVPTAMYQVWTPYKPFFEKNWYCACVVVRGHLVHPTRSMTMLDTKSRLNPSEF